MQLTARELLLAIAVFAVLVGAFLNCQVSSKAISATAKIPMALSSTEK
jgi:hypothetical protein